MRGRERQGVKRASEEGRSFSLARILMHTENSSKLPGQKEGSVGTSSTLTETRACQMCMTDPQNFF
jgi:hypothetical protein